MAATRRRHMLTALALLALCMPAQALFLGRSRCVALHASAAGLGSLASGLLHLSDTALAAKVFAKKVKCFTCGKYITQEFEFDIVCKNCVEEIKEDYRRQEETTQKKQTMRNKHHRKQNAVKPKQRSPN